MDLCGHKKKQQKNKKWEWCFFIDANYSSSSRKSIVVESLENVTGVMSWYANQKDFRKIVQKFPIKI